MKKNMFKKFLALVITICLLMSMSTFVFAESSGSDITTIANGKVDIGGYSLYVEAYGANYGTKPTIILESGYGMDHSTMDALQAELSKTYFVVTYDRAGLGMSDASPFPRSATVMTLELKRLLNVLKIKGPYVHLGQSSASYISRMFATLYPKETAGIFLLEPSPDNMDELYKAALPPEVYEQINTFFTLEQTYEQLCLDGQIVHTLGPRLKNTKMYLVSGGNHEMGPDAEAMIYAAHTVIANFSDYCTHVLWPENGHILQLECPDKVIEHVNIFMNSLSK